jgi:hypothetical protein
MALRISIASAQFHSFVKDLGYAMHFTRILCYLAICRIETDTRQATGNLCPAE